MIYVPDKCKQLTILVKLINMIWLLPVVLCYGLPCMAPRSFLCGFEPCVGLWMGSLAVWLAKEQVDWILEFMMHAPRRHGRMQVPLRHDAVGLMRMHSCGAMHAWSTSPRGELIGPLRS